MTDRWYVVLSWFLLALALAAPFLVHRVVRRAQAARRTAEQVHSTTSRHAASLSALTTALTATPLLLVMAICGGPPPGESDTARAAKERATSLIASLSEYHATHGTYPSDLTALPALERGGWARFASASLPALSYARDSAGYTLAFEYSGPGMNRCVYRPTHAKWTCHGWY